MSRYEHRQGMPLSERERHVAMEISYGYSYKEVARGLGVSPSTISEYVQRINGKLGTKGRRGITAVMTRPDRVDNEGQLQKTIVEWLSLSRVRFVWFAVPNEGQHKPQYRKHQAAMGVRSGVGDLVLIGDNGQAHLVELKNETGVLSPSQKDFRKECAKLDIPWALCRSLAEFQGTLKGWGLL